MHYGLSQAIGNFNLMAGINDGQLTAGLNYKHAGFSFCYYYQKNIDNRFLKEFLGSSATNGLSLEYRF